MPYGGNGPNGELAAVKELQLLKLVADTLQTMHPAGILVTSAALVIKGAAIPMWRIALGTVNPGGDQDIVWLWVPADSAAALFAAGVPSFCIETVGPMLCAPLGLLPTAEKVMGAGLPVRPWGLVVVPDIARLVTGPGPAGPPVTVVR